MRQCLCIFSYMSVWTVASETVINTAVRRQILKNPDASIHWEELTWHTFYGLSYTFICLSNLATSVFYQEINLLYTPTTFCIVQNCEMDFNNIASCSSACLETSGEIQWRYWSMLCNRENQSYSFVSLSLTSVFHGGFFSYGRSCSNKLTSYHSSTRCAIHQSLWTIHGCSTTFSSNICKIKGTQD